MSEKFKPIEETEEKIEPIKPSEGNTKDEPLVEIILPIGSEGRKISEEVLNESKETVDQVDDAKKETNEMEELRERQGRGELLSQEEIALLNAEKMTGQETKETKETAENEAEKGEDSEQINSWDALETAREVYLAEYQEFVRGGRLGRLRNVLGLAPSDKREMPRELKEAKENYDQAKQLYAQDEWESSVAKLSDGLSEQERNQDEAQIKNKIFNITVLDEADYLQEAEAETFPPKQKGVFMKAYDKWSGLSKTKRVIYSAVMVAGVAGFASLAMPVSAGAAAIGMGGVAGKKLFRGTFGMLMSGVAGETYNRATRGTKSRIEQTATDTAETAREDFDLGNLAAIEKQYQEAIRREQKGKRNLLVGKALAMGVTGVGSVIGIGMLENAIAGEVAPDAGAGGGAKPEFHRIERGAAETPPADYSKEVPEDVQTVPDDAKIGEVGTDEIIKETIPVVPAEIISTEALNPYPIESGDNLWNVLKTKLPEIGELERTGMKDNAVANLIEKIKENPQEYGISSGEVDNLKIGDEIDLEKIHNLLETEKIGGEGLIEHAQGLNEETLSGIENYKLETAQSPDTETQLPADSVTTPEPQGQSPDLKPPTAEEIYEQAVKEGEQNLSVNLDKIGGQFVKEEWNVLKEMPATKALAGIEDFKEKGFFSKIFSSSENDPVGDWLKETTGENYIGNQSDMAELTNRGQLREYLKQAHQEIGRSYENESVGDYLKRYETDNLASEMRAKNPLTSI